MGLLEEAGWRLLAEAALSEEYTEAVGEGELGSGNIWVGEEPAAEDVEMSR